MRTSLIDNITLLSVLPRRNASLRVMHLETLSDGSEYNML